MSDAGSWYAMDAELAAQLSALTQLDLAHTGTAHATAAARRRAKAAARPDVSKREQPVAFGEYALSVQLPVCGTNGHTERAPAVIYPPGGEFAIPASASAHLSCTELARELCAAVLLVRYWRATGYRLPAPHSGCSTTAIR